MTIHYYLGWFSECFPEKLKQSLVKDLTKRKNLVMISGFPSMIDEIGNTERSWLEDTGIKFERYHLINKQTSKSEAIQLIQNASAIFILGGDTVDQNQFLFDYGLSDETKNSSSVVIGASAGAINMSAKWVCSRGFGYDVESATTMKGIGIHNISVISHFDLENDLQTVLDQLTPLSFEMDVYLCNKDCALRSENGLLDFVGFFYKLSKGKLEIVSETL